MTIKSKHNSTKIDPVLQQRTNLVFQKIDIWKKHLIDLTRRNRLLFFTPSRTSTIQITSPSPDEVFQRLVINERTLTFPIPKRERQLVLEGIVATETKSGQYIDWGRTKTRRWDAALGDAALGTYLSYLSIAKVLRREIRFLILGGIWWKR